MPKLLRNKRRKGPASENWARKQSYLTRRVLQDASVGLLALCTGAFFFGMNLLYNHGFPSAPLDDVYIHLQYGRQIGEGQWFSYNDGDPVSTGASSFLYPIVLGVGYNLGFHETQLLAFAIVLGIFLLALTAILGCELGRTLAGEGAGLWTGVLIATNGAFVWGSTSGMEIALLSALLSASLLAFVRESFKGRFLLTPVFLTLAALTRPEGLIFAAVLVGAVLLKLFRVVRERRDTLQRTIPIGLLSLLPLVAGAGQLFFYRLATGTSTANGVRAKSLLFEPIFYPTEFLGQTTSNLFGLAQDLLVGFDLGGNPIGYLFPGAILFFVLGVSRLVSLGENCRSFGLAVVIIFAGVLPSIATLNSWNWHHYRYALPLFPIFLLLAVIGIYSLSAPREGSVGGERRHVSGALVGLALLFSLVTLPDWAVKAGQESAQIREQQVSAGNWITENLPPKAKVGVNDAGAMRYYGEHPIVDLIGLTTNGLAEPYRNGMGSLYEALESMEPDERPDYFLIYPYSWWVGDLANSGVFGNEPLQSFVITRWTEVTGGEEVSAFKADWTLARSGDLPRSGDFPEGAPQGRVRDALDVADLESEREHDYEIRMVQLGLQPNSLLDRGAYPDGREVADGGRLITGDESFTARNLTPGRPLTIVMRTSATEPTGERPVLRVSVDGRDAGRWNFRATGGPGGDWQEPSFTVPAELVRSASVRVELLSFGRYTPYRSHAPFHYWFVQ